MARQRSPDLDKAFGTYKASNGDKPLVEDCEGIKLKAISNQKVEVRR